MTTPYECCPFHSDEDQIEKVQAEDGWHLTCPRTDGKHPLPGTNYTWLAADSSFDEGAASGLTAELGLFEELPAALSQFRGQWVEYGVLEAAYASARPTDFAELVERYGHTAVAAKRYTAAAFLGRALGDLTRTGALHLRFAPATGRWTYNQEVSWWSLDPETPWESRTSWASVRQPMSHVPGSTEVCPIGHCSATDPTDCHCS